MKSFAKLIVRNKLSDEQVLEYFDIVQSVIPTKLVIGYDHGEKVSIDVVSYLNEVGHYTYEVILDQDIDGEEGEDIALLLDEYLGIDFDFEISADIDDYAACDGNDCAQ